MLSTAMNLSSILDRVSDLLELSREDLQASTVPQLRAWAKTLGINKAYQMKKSQLVEACSIELEQLLRRLSVDEQERQQGKEAIKRFKFNDDYTIPISQVANKVYEGIRKILQTEDSLAAMKERINGIVASVARQESANHEFSTVKSRRSDLRKLLEQMVASEGRLLKDDMDTLTTYFYTQYLSFLKEESMDWNRQYKKQVSEKNRAKTPIKIKQLVTDCEKALEQLEKGEKVHWTKLSIAIALGTGRRMSEIHALGDFKVRGEYQLFFSGQGKTRGSENANDAFPIPTLFPATELFKAWNYLKEQGRTIAAEDQKADRNATNRKFGMALSRGMCFYEGINYKGLRAIYAECCWRLLSEQEQLSTEKHIYYSSILGHIREGEGADGTTFKSYMVYNLTDFDEIF